MPGLVIAAFIFALAYVSAIIFDRRQVLKLKQVEYTVHIQAQTEQAEHMDFCVNLYEGESEGTQREKLYKAFQMTEDRRGYQGDRLIDLQKKFQEEQAEQKKNLKLADKKEG